MTTDRTPSPAPPDAERVAFRESQAISAETTRSVMGSLRKAPPDAVARIDTNAEHIHALCDAFGIPRQIPSDAAPLSLYERVFELSQGVARPDPAPCARCAEARAEADEMRGALRGIGVVRSDEYGDDGSEWCITTEPQGEHPVGTLAEALQALLAARHDSAPDAASAAVVEGLQRLASQRRLGAALPGGLTPREVNVCTDAADTIARLASELAAARALLGNDAALTVARALYRHRYPRAVSLPDASDRDHPSLGRLFREADAVVRALRAARAAAPGEGDAPAEGGR